jgi:hypothetical protein
VAAKHDARLSRLERHHAREAPSPMTLTLAEAGELFGEATVREALTVLQGSGAIRESTNGGPE